MDIIFKLHNGKRYVPTTMINNGVFAITQEYPDSESSKFIGIEGFKSQIYQGRIGRKCSNCNNQTVYDST